jgi:hypothetical protein
VRRRRVPITIEDVNSLSGLGYSYSQHEQYIASQREKLRQAAAYGCPPGDYDSYNMVCLFNADQAESDIASWDAMQAPDADTWFNIVTSRALSGMGGLVLTPERAIYGFYIGARGQSAVQSTLAEIANVAGLPGFDWTPYQKATMHAHFTSWGKQTGKPYLIFSYNFPFSELFYGPISRACSATGNSVFCEAAKNMAPGSKFYEQNKNVGYDFHDAKSKEQFMKFVMVLALPVAGYYATAAGAGAGVTAAGTGAGTAVTSGAELAALVEAGTVGVQGAFLEAAALSGASVTYSTATGAILGATLPTGASVAFDAAADPFVQFGIDPSQTVIAEGAEAVADDALMTEVAEAYEGLASESSLQNTAMAEVAGDVAPGTLAELVGENAAAESLANAAATMGAENAAAVTWYQEAGQAVMQKLTAMGKSYVVSQVAQALGLAPGAGEPQSAPGGSAASETGSEFEGYSGGGEALDLQPAGIGATLAKVARPLTLGAGLGLLALFMLGDDERN